MHQHHKQVITLQTNKQKILTEMGKDITGNRITTSNTSKTENMISVEREVNMKETPTHYVKEE